MARTVLVTGGAGYIGSHACKALHRAGYEVVTYDNLSRGHEEAVRWGPFEKGDLSDRERLVRIFREFRVDAVMHFAAYAYVGESVERPDLYYANNVGGTLSLLGAMKDADVRKLVFSSTCATYGIPDVLPIHESVPQRPINPYGASKWMIERFLADYFHAFGLTSVSLRYFNAAGADPDGDVGEDHEPETHLIPLALRASLRDDSTLTVFGTDYPTPDGTCIRDYIHVSDLAAAHVRALQCIDERKVQGASQFNLGIGKGFSVKEVLAATEAVTGRPVKIKIGARRPGDPAVLVADATLAQKQLGWSAEFQSLEPIIRTAKDWMERK